jgi:hypothetical protein
VTSKKAEDEFLAKQAMERRKSLSTLGDRITAKPLVLESEGTETRKPYVSPFQEQQTMRARANSAGRRRRKRKHTRRRR